MGVTTGGSTTGDGPGSEVTCPQTKTNELAQTLRDRTPWASPRPLGRSAPGPPATFLCGPHARSLPPHLCTPRSRHLERPSHDGGMVSFPRPKVTSAEPLADAPGALRHVSCLASRPPLLIPYSPDRLRTWRLSSCVHANVTGGPALRIPGWRAHSGSKHPARRRCFVKARRRGEQAGRGLRTPPAQPPDPRMRMPDPEGGGPSGRPATGPAACRGAGAHFHHTREQESDKGYF